MSNNVGTLLFLLIWAVILPDGHTQDAALAQKPQQVKAKPQVALKEIGPINPVLDSISKGQNDTINVILNKVDQTGQVAKATATKTSQVERKVDGLNKDLVDIYSVLNPKKFSSVEIHIAPIPPISYVRPIDTGLPLPEVTPEIDRGSRFWRKVKSFFKRL